MLRTERSLISTNIIHIRKLQVMYTNGMVANEAVSISGVATEAISISGVATEAISISGATNKFYYVIQLSRLTSRYVALLRMS